MLINGLKVLVITFVLFNATSSYALSISGSEFPPFVQKNADGKIAGPFFQMIKDVCQEMKEPCQFSLLPNQRLKHMVNTGKVDAGFAYGWNTDRAKYLYYSVPFMLTEYGFFVPASNDKQIDGPKDFQGYTVGVSGPKSNMSYTLHKIRDKMISDNLKPIEIFENEDNNGKLIRMVELNRINAYFANKSAGYSAASKVGATQFRYAWQYKQLLYFVVFHKKYTDKETVRKFNQAALRVFEHKGYLENKLSPWKISVPPLDEKTLQKYNVIYK